MQTSVHRNEPNRPHISSDTSNVKERGDKKPTGVPIARHRPPDPHLLSYPLPRTRTSAPTRFRVTNKRL
ncbi:hypothetical protein KTJ87_18115, partial [Rhodobacteraceae bacterium ASV31]|nr:hypothetical protein [Anianabacter salinae]